MFMNSYDNSSYFSNNFYTANKVIKREVNFNIFFKTLTIGFMLLFLISFIVLFCYMLFQGVKGYSLANFSITKKIWLPSNGEYGIASFIVTTLISLLISLLISVPLSLGFCLFVYGFFSKKIRRFFVNFISLLAGVPSVVFGLFGYFIFVDALSLSFSILTASIILALMVLPLMTLFISIGFDSIPRKQFYYSLALGATRFESCYSIYLKNSGLSLTSAILASSTRILGETIAVTMLIGGNPAFVSDPLKPSANMTSIIAVDFQEASGAWRSALFSIGLTLLIFITFFNALVLIIQAKFFNKNKKKKAKIKT